MIQVTQVTVILVTQVTLDIEVTLATLQGQVTLVTQVSLVTLDVTQGILVTKSP